MKKLYSKGAIHPSPSSTTSDPIFSLSFLPATILALTAALSIDDKQVLAYWARWDSSPNRQLIHEIIDAFEDNLLAQRKKKHVVNKKDKKKNVHKKSLDDYGVTDGKCERLSRVDTESGEVGSVEDGDEAGEKQGSVRKMFCVIENVERECCCCSLSALQAAHGGVIFGGFAW
ncbi:uncharacterized protein LOC141637934 [Silene latifolia]|uniref:uncharacterized protein LOC141637934 n=1 Tax=Silene latifolia TaxID=37657 RepID=UPI003D780468